VGATAVGEPSVGDAGINIGGVVEISGGVGLGGPGGTGEGASGEARLHESINGMNPIQSNRLRIFIDYPPLPMNHLNIFLLCINYTYFIMIFSLRR
jgi:hypothetical protein